jgi:hypothetical protein
MRLGTAALTVALSLAAVGLAAGQEESTGSWLSRLTGSRSGRTAQRTESFRIDPAALAAVDLERQRQAKSAWERRVKACLALREIADNLNDEDLRRKADELDRRAWEVYQAAIAADHTPERILPKENR